MKLARKLTVLNEHGICARQAALIVKTADKHGLGHKVTLEKDGVAVSAREILGLLTLEGHQDAEILVTVEGPEAQRVLDAITAIFNDGFRRAFDCAVKPVPASHAETIVIQG